MTREPTIADCTSGGDGDEESRTDTEGDESRRRASTTGGREGSDPDAAEPARATYGWGSYDCARCGSATERVWRGEEGVLCSDCKEW
ncbi:hypothetical protein [Saliphagus sp. LR7]|uniref:DUF7573 domain-containing protein n=1 Tax=Saliphagus sp. LR7 TaxID=2282654 RepID=UPI000DF72829|nr:hypothetical protein [Saliphagus sp. LR7]